ncbi:MAG: HAD family hydrolase, partial [Pseudomonadota bacterium]
MAIEATFTHGILFDKDGTLFDFSATWAGVLDATLAALTDDVQTRARMASATGYNQAAGRFLPGSLSVAAPLDEVAEIWSQHLPERTSQEVEAIANQIAEEAATSGALVPAVQDMGGLLDGLRAEGYALGVATHDSEQAALSHLAAAEVLDRFDFIAGYDSGHGLKPGPGMLLAFSAATGVPPARVVMVGDSVHDLGVVPAAGAAFAVGVLTGPATR